LDRIDNSFDFVSQCSIQQNADRKNPTVTRDKSARSNAVELNQSRAFTAIGLAASGDLRK
jgi:hypothetical protein